MGVVNWHYQIINIDFRSLELHFRYDFIQETLVEATILPAHTVDRREVLVNDLSG